MHLLPIRMLTDAYPPRPIALMSRRKAARKTTSQEEVCPVWAHVNGTQCSIYQIPETLHHQVPMGIRKVPTSNTRNAAKQEPSDEPFAAPSV